MRNPDRRLQLLSLGLCLVLMGCNQSLPPWHAGKLIAAIPESAEGPEAEFERELTRLFADQLHVAVETVPLPEDEIVSALHAHKIHLAATPLRVMNYSGGIHFGPSYLEVRELLICNDDQPPIESPSSMGERKLAVAAGSSHETALLESKTRFPTLQWQAYSDLTTLDLLTKVGESALDCVIANELQFNDARNYHPNLVANLELAAPSKLAWGLPEDADQSLREQVQIFFDRIQRDGTLHRLMDRYYGHHSRLTTTDSTAFIVGINTILPHYRRLFEEAATLTGLDWRLLAALAYQESQWNPLATSSTNVRGMMMLTGETADQMEVSNRLDARESIIAGSKYLRQLKDQLPRRIAEPDRTWMALAAYNQGSGHLEDARILASRAGQNPDSWPDVKKWMPLLSKPDYYNTLKHGYARGGEAVILVESIRSYYDMLKRLAPEQPTTLPGEFSYQLFAPIQRLLP